MTAYRICDQAGEFDAGEAIAKLDEFNSPHIYINSQPTVMTGYGQTQQISATIYPPTDKIIKWDSDNTLVAWVDQNGVVIAVEEGTAIISATVEGGVGDHVQVTVRFTEYVSLDKTSATMAKKGETLQLWATLSGSNVGEAVKWISSNPAVATVSNAGLVTAVAKGSTNIYATSASGTTTKKPCHIVVNLPDVSELSNTKQYYIHTYNSVRGSLGFANGALGTTYSIAYNPQCYSASPFAIIKSGNLYYLYSIDGNQFVIQEAEGFYTTEALEKLSESHYSQTPVRNISELEDRLVYTVSTARAAWYVPSGSTQMESTASPSAVSKTFMDSGQQFAFIQHEGKYYIYCVGEKKILNGVTNNNPNRGMLVTEECQPVSISVTGNTDYPLFFSFGNNYNVNINSERNITIDSWSTIDAGNSVALRPVWGVTLAEDELTNIRSCINTGIFDISDLSADTNGICYDISGRRISGIPGKGLYIVNGKKLIIK